ncbi:MAG: oligosaccharide flippase family protein [Sulfitobacter sp.]
MTRLWSFALQWSRVGIQAALFLIAARFLTLAELGLFAAAFAPIRMVQGLHKTGIAETVISLGKSQRRCDALFALSLISGAALTGTLAALGLALNIPALSALALIPLLNGLGAVPDGLLRKSLRLRALALRSMISQGAAAATALYLLAQGHGLWALVTFALLNAALTNALSIWQARWLPHSLPSLKYQSLIGVKAAQIALRDLLSSALLPLAQLAVTAALGLPAAGAFQIATRVMALLDALTLSPLRFIALPQLCAAQGAGFAPVFAAQMRLTATLGVWVWGGAAMAAPQLLTLIAGADHASASAPILRAFCGFGLLSALTMPLHQSLTAQGHTALLLRRAVLHLGAGLALLAPMLHLCAAASAAALSLASLLSALWLLPRALPALGLTPRALLPAAAPLLAGAVMLAALAPLAPLNLPGLVASGTIIYALALAALHFPTRRLA